MTALTTKQDLERDRCDGCGRFHQVLSHDEDTGDDFEGHKKGGRNANDEDTGDDFEGHKKSGRI